MKVVLYLIGTLIAIIVLVFASQMVASESAEVVVLTSQGPDGPEETRLWVVDHQGVQYLRASPDSGWYQRLVAEPDALLARGSETRGYRTEARLDLAGEVNGLMQEKYGWRDTYIDLLIGGRDDAVPVALIPQPGSS
jgi:hypothetical protein